MSVLGVIDLKGGVAVHAVAGQRRHYRPLQLPAKATAGDPQALAQHYLNCGVSGLYVADLDGILRYRPSWSALQKLAEFPLQLWIDVGLREPADLTHATRQLARIAQVTWIVATETCREHHGWREWARAATPGQLALGLDVRAGRLVGSRKAPSDVVEQASAAGVQRFVVLDLASVGGARGPIVGPLCRQVRRLVPQATIVSGGGVRNPLDRLKLQRNGCDLVMMATALLPRKEGDS
jgi:phosphoribosylformimino-5-aminoimidazole carboxamide ribotide isomerase